MLAVGLGFAARAHSGLVWHGGRLGLCEDDDDDGDNDSRCKRVGMLVLLQSN